MNRKLTAETSSPANLLTLSDPLSMRALRAMVPNGRQKPVANDQIGNVITLHDDHPLSFQAGSFLRSYGGKVLAAPPHAVRSRTEAVKVRHEQ
jgi:hypothetical protein